MEFRMTAPIQSLERSNQLDEAVILFEKAYAEGKFQFQSDTFEDRYEQVRQFFVSLGCERDESHISTRCTIDSWDIRDEEECECGVRQFIQNPFGSR